MNGNHDFLFQYLLKDHLKSQNVGCTKREENILNPIALSINKHDGWFMYTYFLLQFSCEESISIEVTVTYSSLDRT